MDLRQKSYRIDPGMDSAGNTAHPSVRSAVVIVPGETNYYYDMEGRRLVESLRELGVAAELHTLRSWQPRPVDVCLFVNLFEIEVGHGSASDARARIQQLVRQSRHAGMVLLECVRTHWFEESFKICRKLGIERIWDLGLHSQESYCQKELLRHYRFVFSGLTATEQASLEDLGPTPANREVPWAFIGTSTPQRIDLVQRLLTNVDPGGLVYMRVVKPVKANGPDINEEQLHGILRRTRFHVWCAHHDYFYMESQRFRQSLMAGALPIKVMLHRHGEVPDTPFHYLTLDWPTFDGQLRHMDGNRFRERALADLQQLPSLAESLRATILSEAA